MFRLFSKSLCTLAAAFLLTSCFDSREEIWINPDASGAARITLTIPAIVTKLNGGEKGVGRMIDEYLAASPAFSSYSVNSAQKADRIEFEVAVTFDNVMELRKLSDSPAARKLPTGSSSFMGKTDVEFSGLSVNFKREVELGKAVPGAIFLPRSQLAGHKVTTIFHLPRAPTAHNARSVSTDGRTLTWETPLATAFQQPVQTTFSMPLPIPWTIICLAAALFALLTSLLIYYIRRRKKGKERGLRPNAVQNW